MVLTLSTACRKALVLCMLMPFFFSCATYHGRIGNYYDAVMQGNYKKAEQEINRNKLLKAKRNQFLYLVEKGRLAHLQQAYDSSNNYFNEADRFLEANRNVSVKDIAVGTLVNPMMQTYKGEDFERFMIHYYKALNYVYLGKYEDAVVEARRITLRTGEQKDKFNDKDSRYSKDAFSLMLQGMIYEAAHDANNAFISYRNAADIFLLHKEQEYYGTAIPQQLKKDVLRTAWQNGFYDEAERYAKIFGLPAKPDAAVNGGELIVFWENGKAPVKEEENLMFTLVNRDGGFFFTNAAGGFSFPVIFDAGVDKDKVKLADLQTFRLAYPRYALQDLGYTTGSITADSTQRTFEKAEDINVIAQSILKERFLKEAGLALSRLLVKKLAELAVKGNDDEKDDTRKVVAGALQLYSLLSEKADTRNWQTLPAQIQTCRIPLRKGDNQLTLVVNNTRGARREMKINVTGNGGLQFYNVATF